MRLSRRASDDRFLVDRKNAGSRPEGFAGFSTVIFKDADFCRGSC
jgi:hypothetical protein